MNARYEAGKAEANATLEAQCIAAADAQAAITQAAEAKLHELQLQVHSLCTLWLQLVLRQNQTSCTYVKELVGAMRSAMHAGRLLCLQACSASLLCCQPAGSSIWSLCLFWP